ncbi:MAG: capsule assembly Wzi family protein, partial [Gemmatimonadota bacterium]|nr:capsule assembly Wzi family protein [Gemmatimonadota bacterium]
GFGDPPASPFSYVLDVGPFWTAQEGRLLGGRTYWVEGEGWNYPGPVAQAGEELWSERVSARIRIAGSAGAAFEMAGAGGGSRVRQAFADVELGPVVLWGGRRSSALGPSTRGGLVLSGGIPLDGGGLATRAGFRLPWLLDALGRVRITSQLARMKESGTVSNPWFASFRASLDVRPGLTLGLNRATIFGGSGNREDLTLRNVALMFIGITGQLGKSSGFENQVASLDLQTRFRLSNVPLRLDVEWGFDDIGGSWTNVPGLVVALEAPHVAQTGLSIALEHVHISQSCCGNPEWYRHGGLGDGWTDRGRLLGHPLAGQGSEWSLAADWDGSRGALGARVFHRKRGEENLFAPDWQGRARGGELSTSAWIGRQIRASFRSVLEEGTGWRHWEMEAAVSLLWGGHW